MSNDERNVHPYLRRMADGEVQKNHANSDFQRLMWTVFFYEKAYSKNDLAAYLDVAVDTLHAYCNGDLRLHVDAARKVVQFVAGLNPKDRRFTNYFLKGTGLSAIPVDIGETLDGIICLAVDLRKKVKAAVKSGNNFEEE